MTLTIMLSISLMLSIMFMMLNHPLSMSLVLLMQTLMITMMTSYSNSSSWFSYIMFLIMIGSMLVLFIYMTSIASNEKFKFSYKITLMSLLTTITCMPLYLDNFMMTMNINNPEATTTQSQESLPATMIKYFSTNNIMIMITVIMFLLMTLIAVVKITNIKHGTLRQKF